MKVEATILRALRQAADETGVDLPLLVAICWQESRLFPLAIGDLDAGVSLGLGQLNLRGAGAAWRHNPSALLTPLTNARAAAAYLRVCLDAYPDDEARAVAAYNAGITGIAWAGWWQVNGENYVRPVLGTLHAIRTEGLEEDWDEDVPPGLREYGKTLLDACINLRGIADDVLARLRRAGDRARATVEESAGL